MTEHDIKASARVRRLLRSSDGEIDMEFLPHGLSLRARDQKNPLHDDTAAYTPLT